MLGKSRIAVSNTLDVSKTHLGQLLIAAKIIDNKSLHEGLQLSKRTFLPLGRVLAIMGKIQESDLPGILAAQELARDGKVPLEQITAVLANAFYCGSLSTDALHALISEELSMDEVDEPARCADTEVTEEAEDQESSSVSQKDFCNHVLALLYDAEQVTASSIRSAMEKGTQTADIPQTLCELGMIDVILLDLARQCEILIMRGFMTRQHALSALACYANGNDPMSSTAAMQGSDVLSLIEPQEFHANFTRPVMAA